jgi:hypothetical protein
MKLPASRFSGLARADTLSNGGAETLGRERERALCCVSYPVAFRSDT